MSRKITCPLEVGGVYEWRSNAYVIGTYRWGGVLEKSNFRGEAPSWCVGVEIIKEEADADDYISSFYSAVSLDGKTRWFRKDILSQKCKASHFYRVG